MNHDAAETEMQKAANVVVAANDAAEIDSAKMMEAANLAGATVLMCTVMLGLMFFAMLLWRARSRYREYMLGITATTTNPAATSSEEEEEQQQQSCRACVISLYPALPLNECSSGKNGGARIADAADELEDDKEEAQEEEEEEEAVQIYETK